MPDEFSDLWRNQPTETPAVIMKLIEQKSRDLRARTRRKLLGMLGGPLAIGCMYLFALKLPLQPLIRPPLLLALAWSLAGVYFLARGMPSAGTPGDAVFSTCLDFCRKEIERQRDLLRRSLIWMLGPILLALGTLVLALVLAGTRTRGFIPNGLPFVVLVVVWIISYAILRVREGRDLERELDELREIEQ